MNSADDSRPLPSAPIVAAHLKRYRPRGNSKSIAFFAVAVLCIGLAATTSESSGLIAIVPWILLIGLIAWSVRRAKRMQAISEEVVAIYEQTMTHLWREAIDSAWRLLPRITEQPQAHAQVVSMLGGALAHLRAHDAAIAAFDHLLRYLPPDNPAGRQIRLQRLRSLLGADRLTDANEEIARLSRADLGPVETAHLALADLQQRVHTNHVDDIAGDDAAHIEALRPLGVEAAEGYALVAAAMRAKGRDEDAGRWWRRATMLMPPGAIAWAQPDIAPLLELPAAPSVGSVASSPNEGGVIA